MRKSKIVYYTGLALVSIVFTGGAVNNLYLFFTSSGEAILGYPPYFAGILGTAQLLGVICLLFPGFHRLKEWAYAGFYFNLISALVSHLIVEGIVPVVGIILFILTILSITYVFFHRKQRFETEEQS